jgi:hypothetical protein
MSGKNGDKLLASNLPVNMAFKNPNGTDLSSSFQGGNKRENF